MSRPLSKPNEPDYDFNRPNLRLDPAKQCSIRGFAFRSPDRLPVLFG